MALLKLCKDKRAQRLGFIEDQLHFLADRMFWFVATPENRLAGWQDFWSFVHVYHFLPPAVKDQHGPYYFTITPAQIVSRADNGAMNSAPAYQRRGFCFD